jgi:hypothetical protein
MSVFVIQIEHGRSNRIRREGRGRTGGKALLQLLSLVGVLENEGVQVAGASDLELGQGGLLALLYARRYNSIVSKIQIANVMSRLATYTLRPCGGRSQ